MLYNVHRSKSPSQENTGRTLGIHCNASCCDLQTAVKDDPASQGTRAGVNQHSSLPELLQQMTQLQELLENQGSLLSHWENAIDLEANPRSLC